MIMQKGNLDFFSFDIQKQIKINQNTRPEPAYFSFFYYVIDMLFTSAISQTPA